MSKLFYSIKLGIAVSYPSEKKLLKKHPEVSLSDVYTFDLKTAKIKQVHPLGAKL